MDKIDLRHVAHLARLHFKDEELKVFESQVAGILEFVDELKTVPVEGVEPTSHPLALENVFREDAVKASLEFEPFLSHAPKARGRFFEVPKIIEEK
jgi:aspartyl-tRNA(Asn)/glutamyl-tRNA(Gln) amidotransferase subunit C